MRRYLRQSADFLKWSFVLAILVGTCLLVAGRFMVNQLYSYRASIQSGLSDMLSTRVDFDTVSGDWQGVLPLIHMHGVSLGGDLPFLVIDELNIEPDYLRSLFRNTLIVRRLDVQGLKLQLKEDAEGRWRLGSFSGVTGQGTGETRQRLIDTLMRSELIDIEDTRLQLDFISGEQIELILGRVKAENKAGFHRFLLEAFVESEQNPLQMVVEIDEGSLSTSGQIGRGYLSLAGKNFGQPMATLFDYLELPEQDWESAHEPGLEVAAWLDFYEGGIARLSGSVSLQSVSLGDVTENNQVLSFNSALAGSLEYGGELRLDFVDAMLQLNEESIALSGFSLIQNQIEDHRELTLSVKQLDLQRTASELQRFGLLQGVANDIVDQLNPRGQLAPLEITFDPVNPLNSLLIRANLRQVEVDAFKAAPSAKNVTGYLEAGAFGGFVQLDGEQVSPFYEAVYDAPFMHDRLQGTVGWKVDRDLGAIYVFSDSLSIVAPQGNLQGAFLVDTALQAGAYPTQLTLFIGMAKSGAEHWQSLVPRRVSSNLRDWLTANLDAGDVPQAAFIYRGPLKRELRDQRTIQLRLEARQAELGFSPGWPKLRDVSAELLVNNADVQVNATSARLGDIQLTDSSVEVWADERSRIFVKAPFLGQANEILDLVRATPVRGLVGNALDSFDVQSRLQGRAELDFPLSQSFSMDALNADIEANFAGNTLRLTDTNLEITDIKGELHFDRQGLWSDTIAASLWDRPLELEISSSENINVAVQTSASVDHIAQWLQLDLLNYWSGIAPVSGNIEVFGPEQGTRAIYRFESPLNDIQSELPEPLSKTAGDPVTLQVEVVQADQNRTLDLILEDRIQVRARWGSANDIEAISLGVGASSPGLTPGSLTGFVALTQLNTQDWLNVFGTSGGGNMGLAGALDPYIEVSAQSTLVGGRQLGATHAVVSRTDTAWSVDFAATWGNGEYQFGFEDTQKPPNLHFRSLDADSWLQGEQDEISEINPAELPELSVQIDRLTYKERDLGNWKMRMVPREDGLQIVDIDASIKDVRVIGNDQATSLFWRLEDGKHFTQLELSLEFGNAETLFELLGQPSPFSSDSGSLYASFAWPDQPTKMFANPLSGILGISLEDGVFDTQVEGLGNAILRVVGLFNINSWARRLQFDFSDVTAEGTSYDSITGDFVLDAGILSTLTPVDARLSSGRMRFDGSINLVEDSVDAQLVATLPLRENMTWVAGLVAGLPGAIGAWVIGQLFQEEVENLTSVSYRISGDIDKPDVKTERVFESTIGN